MEFKISFPKLSNSNTIALHYCKAQHGFTWSVSCCSPAEAYTGLTQDYHTNMYMIFTWTFFKTTCLPQDYEAEIPTRFYLQARNKLGGQLKKGASQNTNLQRKVSILRKPVTANPFLQKRLHVVTISLSFFLQYYSLSPRGGCGCAHTHLFTHTQRAKVCVESPPLLFLTLCYGIWPLPKAGSLLSLDTGLSFSAHT